MAEIADVTFHFSQTELSIGDHSWSTDGIVIICISSVENYQIYGSFNQSLLKYFVLTPPHYFAFSLSFFL